MSEEQDFCEEGRQTLLPVCCVVFFQQYKKLYAQEDTCFHAAYKSLVFLSIENNFKKLKNVVN